MEVSVSGDTRNSKTQFGQRYSHEAGLSNHLPPTLQVFLMEEVGGFVQVKPYIPYAAFQKHL